MSTVRIPAASAVVAAVVSACAALCTGAAEPPPASTGADEELDEVLVRGAKPEKSGQKVIEWMARLVGEFTFEGHFDPQERGARDQLLPVTGRGTCLGFGPAPAVQCDLRVRWPTAQREDGAALPGTAPNLDPAMLIFGFETNRFGVHYLLVDNRGIAEGALGRIHGDTLFSKSACVNSPGNCQRIVHITAPPDLESVTIAIDIEIDHAKARGYSLVMNRMPGSRSVVTPGRR